MAPKAKTLLADGWSALVYGLLGDHDYKRDCLLLNNINSANPCFKCKANKDGSGGKGDKGAGKGAAGKGAAHW